MQRRVRWVLAPAMIGLVGIAGAACSSTSSGSAEAVSSSSGTSAASTSASSTTTASAAPAEGAECAVPGAPVTELKPLASTDPTIGVPVPDGWTRNTTMDSEVLRGVFMADELSEDGFTPNVTIVVEDLTGKVPTAEDGVQAELDGFEALGGKLLSQDEVQLCGYPAAVAQVRLPAMGAIPERDGTVLAVVSEADGKMTAMVMTFQSMNSQNPAYVADVQTIVEGVQITQQPVQG